MPTLQDSLQDPSKRKALVADCTQMIDDEVASKGGLSGIAIKTAFKVVKGVKPGFIEESVDHLLNDFARVLQPMADEASEKGISVSDHFVANRGRVADSLLSITDDKAKRSHHAVVKGTYEKLRPSAKKNVEDAVPRIGQVIQKHVSA